MSNPTPILNNINAFDATKGTIISFNIIGGTDIVRSNIVYIYDLSTNDLICTHLYISTESVHELPPNTDPSIVYADGKSSADFINNKNYYLQIQTFTNTAGTTGGSGMSVAKTFWCLFDPALSVNAIPAAISTTSYNVGATYTTNITDVTIPVTNIIQQYKFDLYTATGTLVQTSGNIIGSGEQEGTSTTYNITYNFSGLVVNNSYYVVVTTTSTEGMTVSAQSNTFTVSIDTPTVGAATATNNSCDGYISVVSNLSSEYGGNVSGEMASFETDSVNNVSSLKVDMEPIQDLHGYDHPWVGGAGKQLIPITESAEYIKYGVTISVSNDGVITFGGTSTSAFSQTFLEFELPAGAYVFSGFGSTSQSIGGNTYIYIRDIDNNRTLGEMTVGNTERRDTFTLTTQTRVRFYMVCSEVDLTLSGKVKVLLTDASVTDTSYAPYENICPITGWTGCEVTKVGTNLFDKSSIEVGKWLNDLNGNTASVTGYNLSDYIPIKPNTTYYKSDNGSARILYYDATKTLIPTTAWGAQGVSPSAMTFTTLSNAHYMRVTLTDAYVDSFRINYPSTDHDYHTYNGQTYTQEIEATYTPTVQENEPYQFKRTGDVGGDRETIELVGGTVAWNQLCETPTSSTWGFEDASGTITNGVAEFTPSARYGRFVAQSDDARPSTVSGHKYIALATVKLTTPTNLVLFQIRDYAETATKAQSATASVTSAQTIGMVYSETTTGKIKPRIIDTRTSGWDKITVSNIMLIDLTQLFGSTIADYIYSLEQANAGAGVAWFKKLFPKPYYEYNAGELMSVNTSAHNTVGFNQFDPITMDLAQGSFDYRNITNKNNVSCYGYIPFVPNATYFWHDTVTADGRYVRFYDADKQLLPNASISKYSTVDFTFTVPPNAMYGRVMWYVSSGSILVSDIVNGDICINLSDPSRNGTYEPYTKHTYPLDSSLTLRGVPKLVDGKLAFDGDTYQPSGEVQRRYGIVDLGTLNWTYVGNSAYFYAIISDKAKGFDNIVCSQYVRAAQAGVANLQDKQIVGGNNDAAVYIKDTSYTDAASFKAAMSGVYLLYEKATPTTETAEPYQEVQVCSPYGTEEYVTTGIVPVGHNTTYLTRDIFGGTLDLVTGVLTVDKAMVDLGTLTWTYQSQNCFYAKDTAIKTNGYVISNVFEPTDRSIGSTRPDHSISLTPYYGSNAVSIKDTRYDGTSIADFIASLDGAYAVVELATPQTYQLTSHQIQTLVGQNNVWSDAGNVEVTFNLPITNLLVKRQDTSDTSGKWLTLYSQPITQASDMDFTYIDFLNQHGKTYRYALVPLLTQQQGDIDVEIEGGYTVSDDVLSVFDGVFIANNNGSQKLKAATEYGDLETNQDVGVLTTIGNKYPFVVSNSNLNYHSGSISALIVPSDFYTSGDLDRLDIVERREAIEQFLTDKTAKVLKDWNGNIWLITFVENVEVSFLDDYGMGLGTLSAKWVEIGDVNDQTDLKQTGLI